MERFSFASRHAGASDIWASGQHYQGGLRGASPNTADEIQHVKSSTKELTQRLAGHQMPSMRAVATAWFRYSAALTPWTDSELEELFKIWMQVEKAAWKLRGFPSAQFQLPTDHGRAALLWSTRA